MSAERWADFDYQLNVLLILERLRRRSQTLNNGTRGLRRFRKPLIFIVSDKRQIRTNRLLPKGSDYFDLVEINGLEPSTSWMPFKRSTRWAISPCFCGRKAPAKFLLAYLWITHLWWRLQGSLLRTRRNRCRRPDRFHNACLPGKLRWQGRSPRMRRSWCNRQKFYVPLPSTSDISITFPFFLLYHIFCFS